MKDKNPVITVTGRVVRGAGYGQKLGFPTANLDRRGYSRLKHKPGFGIYAGTACIVSSQKLRVKSCLYPAAIVVGPRDNKGHPKIETHLLDFSGVLYGKRLTLMLQQYLRPFMSFRNETALKKQISKDIRAVRKTSLQSSTLNREKGRTLIAKSEAELLNSLTQKTASRKWPQRQAPRAQQRFFS